MKRWPFVGRRAETQLILDTLADESVALIGEAGVGKTRLADEVASSLEQRGVTVARVGALSAERGIPLHALRPIIGDESSGDLMTVVHRKLALGTNRPGPGDPVLFVDDAQFLDDQSLAVLAQILRAARVRLLLTIRASDALSANLVAMLRSDNLVRVTLEALPVDEMEQLAGEALGGVIEGRTLRTLVGASQGNPMLLRELLLGAKEGGSLHNHTGVWTLVGPFAATPVLRELVASRVGSLTAEQKLTLELVVVGGSLGLGFLNRSGNIDAVERLEQQGLLAVSGRPAMVDVSHPIYRDVLLEQMGPLARRRCHRQLAESGEGSRLQLAIWRLLGEMPMPPKETLEAAQDAADLGDPALGADLAVASYAAEPTIEAAILAGWCLSTSGRQADAEALAEQAQTALTDARSIACLGLRRAEERWWAWHDLDQARAILDNTAATLDGPWPDLLRAQHSVFAALSGNANDAVTLAEMFLDSQLVWVRRIASIGAGFGYALTDRNDEAIAISDRAFNESQTDPYRALSGDPGIHLAVRAFAGTYSADIASSLELAQMIYDVATVQPAVQTRAWGSLLLAMTLAASGRPTSAARHALEAEALWVQASVTGLARWSAAIVANAQIDLGDYSAAEETFRRLQTHNGRGFEYSMVAEARIEAWLLAQHCMRAGKSEDGNESARRILVRTAEQVLEHGAIVSAAEVLVELCRLGESDATQDFLARMRHVSGPVTSVRIRLVEAVLAKSAETLELVAKELLGMGRVYDAANAWMFAAGIYQGVGNRVATNVSVSQSRVLLQTCEGAAVPMTVFTDHSPSVMLSARELDIAQRAAAGISNRAIARELAIAERTVESHLYRTFAKLGISHREDLASALA